MNINNKIKIKNKKKINIQNLQNHKIKFISKNFIYDVIVPKKIIYDCQFRISQIIIIKLFVDIYQNINRFI